MIHHPNIKKSCDCNKPLPVFFAIQFGFQSHGMLHPFPGTQTLMIPFHRSYNPKQLIELLVGTLWFMILTST